MGLDIQPYRKSFSILVVDSDVSRGREVVEPLSVAGYTVDQCLTRESLLSRVNDQPPHMIVFRFEDHGVFPGDGLGKSHRDLFDELVGVLPELQILLLAQSESYISASELYDIGVYEVILTPVLHPLDLLRAADRASEANYYMYLNEQLKERISPTASTRNLDQVAMLEFWMRELSPMVTWKDAVQLTLQNLTRYFESDEGIYLRFLPSKNTLVVDEVLGEVAKQDLADVGIDLEKTEPGFEVRLMKRPHLLLGLVDFVHKGLMRKSFVAFPLFIDKEVHGLFLILGSNSKPIRDSRQEDPVPSIMLAHLGLHFEKLATIVKSRRLTILDEDTEVFNREFIHKKIREEISRARRIARPVSLVFLQLDKFSDLRLTQTELTLRNLLRLSVELILKNSRLNDLVGRWSDDTFILILPHTDKKGAVIKAERLRRIFDSADFSSILPNEIVRVSAGISEYPASCHDSDGMVRMAETALEEVMRAGGNRVCLAAPPPSFVPDFMTGELG